ncbi:DUF982 domain-containing protein [Mesorhizobium sp. M0938]|uniref:DUF982 domain-containing protein n=1 Tax=unclassified Mesorhizobium TaxID=325217 RepID=UPI00333C7EB3
MDRLQFKVPVRIMPAPGLPIEEIYSVEQALDFLQAWPVRRQGPVYQAAFNACFGATVDLVETEPLRTAIGGDSPGRCSSRGLLSSQFVRACMKISFQIDPPVHNLSIIQPSPR